MKREALEAYVDPASHEALELEVDSETDGTVATGTLRHGDRSYPIVDGIPDLTYPPTLDDRDQEVRAFYDGRSDVYDKYLGLTFFTHDEDEDEVRNEFIDALELKPDSRVLEVAAGTGRDTEIIASRLGDGGTIHVQDISRGMLERCRERMSDSRVDTHLALSNAAYLPYPDDYFDAVYSFGGLGEFPDIRRSLKEMVRVSRAGAKVVVGDESMPPWLRDTDFSRILITTNKQFEATVPLEEMPVDAREVRLRWVIGGVFYLIDFRVGEGEPKGNFDFEIPGARGGTLRTRYYGQLEGVTPEAKELAYRARAHKGVSMHDWLDRVVREAAARDLDEPGER